MKSASETLTLIADMDTSQVHPSCIPHKSNGRSKTTCMYIRTDLAEQAMDEYASQFKPSTSVSAEDVLRLLPDGDEINKAADDYGFRVPYDSSNKFYDESAIKHFLAGVAFVEHHVNQSMHDFASRKPAGMRWVKCTDETLPTSGFHFVKIGPLQDKTCWGSSKIIERYNELKSEEWLVEIFWLDESTPDEYSLDNGLGTTTVYGGKPAGEGYVCQCCNKEYNYDLIVSDDVWKRIAPKSIDGYKGGGLLCPECIVAKILSTPSNWIEIKEGGEKPG